MSFSIQPRNTHLINFFSYFTPFTLTILWLSASKLYLFLYSGECRCFEVENRDDKTSRLRNHLPTILFDRDQYTCSSNEKFKKKSRYEEIKQFSVFKRTNVAWMLILVHERTFLSVFGFYDEHIQVPMHAFT